MNAPGLRQLFPGPYGPAWRMRKDTPDFLLELHRRFGDVARFRLGPFVIHLLAHPDHVRHVLLDNPKNYVRSWAYGRASLAAGKGLVTTDGPVWRRLRRMSQPAFHPQRIAALDTLMNDAIGAMLAAWDEHARAGTPVDAAEEFLALTLRISGRALVSADLDGVSTGLAPAVKEAIDYVEYRLNNLLSPPLFVPTPRNLRFRRARRAIDTFAYGLIDARRRNPDPSAVDLLARLLSTRDEETGEGLTDRELRDQVLTMLVAGYETTAVALTWACYLVATHPEAEARIREEVAAVPGDRVPQSADLPRLAYTRRVIEESLRMYPPVFAVVRDAVADDTIGGFRIPRRSVVIISPYVTQKHPAFWPDPDRFDPDRFLPENSADRPRLAWFPFLGGPHQCIGQDFAVLELVLALARIVRSFHLELATPGPVTTQTSLTLRPRGGLPIFPRAVNPCGSVPR